MAAVPLGRATKIILRKLRALHSNTGAHARHHTTLPTGSNWSSDPNLRRKTRTTSGNIAISAEGACSTS